MGKLIIQIIVVIAFTLAAVVQFYIGNHTNGILWLIMCEVYIIRVKVTSR